MKVRAASARGNKRAEAAAEAAAIVSTGDDTFLPTCVRCSSCDARAVHVARMARVVEVLSADATVPRQGREI